MNEMNEKNNFLSKYRSFKEKLVKKLEKPVKVLKIIFGYGIMLTLFAGGALTICYIVAFILGGSAAVAICDFLKLHIIPIITYAATSLVLFGLIIMYMSGQFALTREKKKAKLEKK